MLGRAQGPSSSSRPGHEVPDVGPSVHVTVLGSIVRVPGFRLHPIRGDLTGYWSAAVSANWSIEFRFEGADAGDVALVDYH